MHRSTRIVGLTLSVSAATALSVAPASATAPRAGASYKGQVTAAPSEIVTFTVSKSGKYVTKLHVGPGALSSCSSGGPPPTQTSKRAAITNGKFTAHVSYSGGGNVFAKAKVTGTFLRKGKEKGVVTSVFSSAPTCGESLAYTTHAQ